MYGIAVEAMKLKNHKDALFKVNEESKVLYDDVKMATTDKIKHLENIRKFFQTCRKTGICSDNKNRLV